MLQDQYGRQITYLRISVTDRCNFRCVYCMPVDGVLWQSHGAIMHYEEIVEVVRVAVSQGVSEVRLTGGEPLVRKDLPELVRLISAIPGIQDISLTTNGILLDKLAGPLAQAGLKRVNISLDTLDPEKYNRITRGGSLIRFWDGLHAAEIAGLNPIKLNVVAMRGVNDEELVDLARLSLEHDWQVRFIEIMPIRNQESWGPGFPSPEGVYLSIQEMLKIFEPCGLLPVEHAVGSGPAREYRLQGAAGTIGFISPLGEKFCDSCNRLRLTADGFLRPCLLKDIEIPILPALRAGESILPLLMKAVELKPSSHELEEERYSSGRCMRQIGG
ncbi:MAG: GTP 3',8-cyclase MoaA [Anaerolineaceae bacterium]